MVGNLKNSEPFGMNFRKFRINVYEFFLFEDARFIQIYVVIKILKKLPNQI